MARKQVHRGNGLKARVRNLRSKIWDQVKCKEMEDAFQHKTDEMFKHCRKNVAIMNPANLSVMPRSGVTTIWHVFKDGTDLRVNHVRSTLFNFFLPGYVDPLARLRRPR